MSHAMYWLEVDGDRTGLDVVVNGFPVDRMMRSHGGRLPINEFLRPGDNAVELRRGLWASNKEDSEAGEASLKLVEVRYANTVKLDERVLVEETRGFASCAARTVLVAAGFRADEAPAPPLAGGFDPVGPAERERILDRLEQVAGYWRNGNGQAIVDWMRPYLRDYVASYALETQAAMELRIQRMAEAFARDRAEFDRGQTLLDPVPGTNLVDCLGPRGAAVRVARAGGPDYDMWAVVGVRGGEVVLVR